MLFLSEHVGIRNSYSSSNEWLNRHSFYSLASIFGVSDPLSNVYDTEKKTLKNQKEFCEGLGFLFKHVLVS